MNAGILHTGSTGSSFMIYSYFCVGEAKAPRPLQRDTLTVGVLPSEGNEQKRLSARGEHGYTVGLRYGRHAHR
jgi:hypothetical protein